MGSLWHPFAPMAHVAEHPFVVVHGEGAYVFDEAGRRYLDGTASLWYANIGYGRSEVADAVARQMETLHAYHLFVDFATPPRWNWPTGSPRWPPSRGARCSSPAGGPTRWTPQPSWRGATSTRSGSRSEPCSSPGSGLTTGCTVSGRRWGGWSPTVSGTGPSSRMSCWYPHDDPEAVEKAIDHVGAERVAAMICEPVIGAGGVRPAPEGYLPSVREAVRRAGALFVADEVITGFGRCGDWFASTRFDLEPDIITFAKGVTAGYLPLGGVIAAPHSRRSILRASRRDLAARLHLLRSCRRLRRRPGRSRHHRAGRDPRASPGAGGGADGGARPPQRPGGSRSHQGRGGCAGGGAAHRRRPDPGRGRRPRHAGRQASSPGRWVEALSRSRRL